MRRHSLSSEEQRSSQVRSLLERHNPKDHLKISVKQNWDLYSKMHWNRLRCRELWTHLWSNNMRRTQIWAIGNSYKNKMNDSCRWCTKNQDNFWAAHSNNKSASSLKSRLRSLTWSQRTSNLYLTHLTFGRNNLLGLTVLIRVASQKRASTITGRFNSSSKSAKTK